MAEVYFGHKVVEIKYNTNSEPFAWSVKSQVRILEVGNSCNSIGKSRAYGVATQIPHCAKNQFFH